MKRVAKGCNILFWVTRKNFLHHFFFILKDKDLYHKSLLSKKKQAIENTVCNTKNVTGVLLIYFFLLSNSSHLVDYIYSKIQSAWSPFLDLFAISDVDNCYSISFQVFCPIFFKSAFASICQTGLASSYHSTHVFCHHFSHLPLQYLPY